jgi:3-oxoacyl-[acyl-carrier protein] reductase
VTGASRGIGQASALGLAHEGAEIVINYQQDAQAAEDIVNTITRARGRARAIQADSSDLEQMRRFFVEVGTTYPQIDILVNNVGTASAKPEPLGAVDPAEYDRIFNLSTRGLFFTSQEALKLIRDGGGRIVNISSLASRVTAPGRSVYAGTKGAVEAFSRVWAAELGGRGITVNSVSPGTVETERMKKTFHRRHGRRLLK